MAKAKNTKKAENEELADELLTDLNEEKAADDISIESEPEEFKWDERVEPNHLDQQINEKI